MKKSKNKASEHTYIYAPRDIANGKIKAKDFPKPDPFTYWGHLVPGTGCLLPGTNIVVPGTGIYQRRDGTKFIPDGFKLTRNGTHFRPVVPPDEKRCLPLRDETEYTHAAYQKELEGYNQKLVKRTKPKNHYARMMARRAENRQIKKSAIKLIKQTIRDSTSFKMNERHVSALLKEAKDAEKHRIDSETGRIVKAEKIDKKAAKKKAADKFVNKNFKYTKADAVLSGLAPCFNITPFSLAKVRTSVRRRESMLVAGKLWERGRKKKLNPRKKRWRRAYIDLPTESELSIIQSSKGTLEQYCRLAAYRQKVDNLELSLNLDKPRFERIFDYSGGYARAGDPKKIMITEPLQDRIKTLKAQEAKQTFFIPVTEEQKKAWQFRKHQKSQHNSRQIKSGQRLTATTRPESGVSAGNGRTVQSLA